MDFPEEHKSRNSIKYSALQALEKAVPGAPFRNAATMRPALNSLAGA